MKYKVIKNLKHDGTVYTPGDTVELNDNVANGLLKSEVVEEIKEKTPKKTAQKAKQTKKKAKDISEEAYEL